MFKSIHVHQLYSYSTTSDFVLDEKKTYQLIEVIELFLTLTNKGKTYGDNYWSDIF
jgi:hypothetical protein